MQLPVYLVASVLQTRVILYFSSHTICNHSQAKGSFSNGFENTSTLFLKLELNSHNFLWTREQYIIQNIHFGIFKKV